MKQAIEWKSELKSENSEIGFRIQRCCNGNRKLERIGSDWKAETLRRTGSEIRR
ncbi:hypothetical protein Hanom_Chr09g00767661 [Helianthus anomalus]